MASKYTMEIIVGNKKIPEYKLNEATYVEGRAGSEFSIKLYNWSNKRSLFVVSVDGLSVTDGKPAGPDSIGFIVEPHSSYMVPGWVVSNSESARFKFDSIDKSYAGTESKNVGVIGAMVFEELVKEEKVKYVDRYIYINTPPVTDPYPWKRSYPSEPWTNPIWYSTCQNNMLVGNASSSLSSNTQEYEASGNELGVTWGESVSSDFSTNTFDKGAKKDTLVLFYDSRKNLEKLGIVFDKKPTISRNLPNPFPLTGCTPPPNWKK